MLVFIYSSWKCEWEILDKKFGKILFAKLGQWVCDNQNFVDAHDEH